MSLKAIERLLEQKIGLAIETMGADSITSIIRRRMDICGVKDDAAYLDYLMNAAAEWDELIEAVVVPETWFFRNEESFTFLAKYIKLEWLPQHPLSRVRGLSIPCSTGEEPYSMAMTFVENGVVRERIAVDAVDISSKALNKARRGVYGPESFRRADTLAMRDRYFTTTPEGYRLDANVMSTVQFLPGNLLDSRILTDTDPYDIIFCRNLLIYLNPEARKKISQIIDRLLAKNGLLFVGHAERPLFQAQNFMPIATPGVFAYYRAGQLDEGRIVQECRLPVRFERRKSSSSSVASAAPTAQPAKTGSAVPIAPAIPAPQPKRPPSVAPPKDAPAAMSDSQVFLEHRRKAPNTLLEQLDVARRMADQGKLQEALRLCQTVIAENAAHVQTHFLMGLIYQALHDEMQAEKSFHKTIYLDPNHHEALYYLALIQEDRGHHDRARQLRQRIQRIYQRTQKEE